jgi:hypothetical protein
MATNHGVKTNVSGLVFGYDMYDVRNSYKGEPTTNLYGSLDNGNIRPYVSTHYWDGYRWIINNTYSHPGVDGPPGVFLGKMYKHTSGALNSTWSGNSYGYMLRTLTLSNGVTYTMSSYIYVSVDSNLDDFRSTTESATTNNLSVSGYSTSYNLSNKGTWQRLSVQCVAGTGGINFIPAYPSKSGVTDGSFAGFFMFAMPQVEQKTYPTWTTDTSRSNTDSLVNIRDSTQTMNVSGVSFSSNGTFSFDGTNDTLALPTALEQYFYPSITEVTVEVIFKATVGSSGSGGPLFENYRFNFWYNYTNNTMECMVRTGPPDYPSYSFAISLSSGTLRTKGLYNHVVMVYKKTASNSGQLLVYANGSLSGSGTGLNMGNYPYVSATVGSSSHSGGNVYWMNGEVPIVRVYNRELPYNDVIANFESLRGRFSI